MISDCSHQLFSHSQHLGDLRSGDETHLIWGTKEPFLLLCFQVNILHPFTIFTAHANWVIKPLCLWGFFSHLWLSMSWASLLYSSMHSECMSCQPAGVRQFGDIMSWNSSVKQCTWISARLCHRPKSSWLSRICLFLIWIWKDCRAECWNKNHDNASCETSQYSVSELKDVFLYGGDENQL
jgi:hypothetical protein